MGCSGTCHTTTPISGFGSCLGNDFRFVLSAMIPAWLSNSPTLISHLSSHLSLSLSLSLFIFLPHCCQSSPYCWTSQPAMRFVIGRWCNTWHNAYIYIHIYVYIYCWKLCRTRRWRKFQNRKPIGELGCCESRMAERIMVTLVAVVTWSVTLPTTAGCSVV